MVAVLDPVHIEVACLEIDLLPPQCHEFRRTEAMAKQHQNDSRIAHPMPPRFPGGLHHGVHLVRPQIVAHGGIVALFSGRSRKGACNFPTAVAVLLTLYVA